MNIQGIGLKVCVGYVLPYLVKITKSLISHLAKSMYEKLYNRFTNALNSIEAAIDKLLTTKDAKKLKKGILCCKLGLKFLEKIKEVLEDVLPDYNAALGEAENKLAELTGEIVEGFEDD